MLKNYNLVIMGTAKHSCLGFVYGVIVGMSFTLMMTFYIYAGPSNMWSSITSIHEVVKKDMHEENKAIEVRTSAEFVAITPKPTVTVKNIDIDENVTAEQLYNKVRVLCWVMTSPNTLHTKAIHVKDTWSKRCNIRLFMSSKEDKDFPAVALPVREGRSELYEKTKAAYTYIWQHYKDQADWFIKADDDTFVIVENLRFLLKDYDPSKPIFFGRKFKPYVKQGYMSGGAGYVLSKEATKRFVDGVGLNGKCPKGGGVEDVEIGKCMSILGVVAGDSRDSLKRETFHPLGPIHHIIPGKLSKDFWYWNYNFYPTCSGKNCSSNYPITFHYISPDEMHLLDYMIYDVNVYGMGHHYRRYPKLPYEA